MLARSGGALKVLVLFHTKPKGSIFFYYGTVYCAGNDQSCVYVCVYVVGYIVHC